MAILTTKCIRVNLHNEQEMVKSYELYSNYTPIIIQAAGGVQVILLLIMLVMLYRLNKKVDNLEQRVTRLIGE